MNFFKQKNSEKNKSINHIIQTNVTINKNTMEIFIKLKKITVADIDDTEVICIEFIKYPDKHWFYLKLEQINHNINNYQY